MKNGIETRPTYKGKSWGKQKNIRPPSTYLFGAEAGEEWPEAAKVEATDGGVLPCL